MNQLEFERDSDLRHWEIYADSNDRVENGFEFKQEKTGECCLIISDKLIRELCFRHCHPFKSWQEWKTKEEEFERKSRQFDIEVQSYKLLNPDREVNLNSSIADIAAKSEQLAEKELEGKYRRRFYEH